MKKLFLFAIIILAFCLIPESASAARLWSNGFELQSVTSNVEWNTTTGAPTISTAIKRSGAASLRANPTATTAYLTQDLVATATDNRNMRIRFYLRIDTSTDALDSIFTAFDGYYSETWLSVRLNSNRTLELWDDYSNSQRGSDSSPLTLGQWYRIEITTTYNSYALGSATLYIDGVQVATGNAGGDEACQRITFGAVTATTADLYFDDIAVNDHNGTTQNSLPGAGSIIHMQPDSAGDAAATAGTFDSINEETPNDATDYIEVDTDSGGQQANYNFESWTGAGGGSNDTITLVQVGTRQRAETAASFGWTPQIKSQTGGTTVNGTATTHALTAWYTHDDVLPRLYRQTSYTDPQAGGAWTPALLTTMIAGVNVTDGNPDGWFSTIWVLVDYIPGEEEPPAGATYDYSEIILRPNVIFKKDVIFK